jgi:hypothetical protein
MSDGINKPARALSIPCRAGFADRGCALRALVADSGEIARVIRWDFRNVIAAGPAKVHLDVQFTRYRADNSVIGSFRSLGILTQSGGGWAVAARSSFAN